MSAAAFASFEARRDCDKQSAYMEPHFAFEASQVDRCERAIRAIDRCGLIESSTVSDIVTLLAQHAEWLAADCPAGADAQTVADYAESAADLKTLVAVVRADRGVRAGKAHLVVGVLRCEVLPRLVGDLATARLAAEFAADAWGDDA